MIGKTATIKKLGHGWTGTITAAGNWPGFWIVCGIQCHESDLWIHAARTIADNLWHTCGMHMASGEMEKAMACSGAYAEYVCRDHPGNAEMKRFADDYIELA